jgi:hypothetical protein
MVHPISICNPEKLCQKAAGFVDSRLQKDFFFNWTLIKTYAKKIGFSVL